MTIEDANQPSTPDGQSYPLEGPRRPMAIASSDSSRSRTPRPNRWLWLGLGLLLLGGLGWIVFTRLILPLLGGAPPSPPPMPVQVANPKSTSVQDSSDYAASLDSRQAVNSQPRVSGQIAAIYVKAGDRVEAGQPLLQIDATEQQAQVDSRAAAAATAAADIAAARADVTNARDTLKSVQARRTSAQSDVQLNQREYERYQTLYKQGAVSQQIVDQRLNALQTARANLTAAEADLQAQTSAIAKAEATVVRNQRALQQAEATVSEGAAQLKYYTISAPFSGVVGNIPVKVGDFVDTDTQLFTIAQNESLDIQIQIPLERAANLRPGLAVQLLDDQNQPLQTGRISFVAPNVDPATQSVQVKAAFNNATGQLRTAQFVRARVIWNSRPGVVIPTTAISRLAGRNFVFVATPAKEADCAVEGQAAPQLPPDQMVAAQKQITLGRIVDSEQEVLDGLKSSDRIVVSGLLQLQNCMPIDPQPQPAKN